MYNKTSLDLISRSALLAELNDDKYTWEDYDNVNFAVQNLPAVDAVIPVRCKDCKAWQTKNAMSFLRNGVHVRCCPCDVLDRLMYDNDFYSRGERRADYE